MKTYDYNKLHGLSYKPGKLLLFFTFHLSLFIFFFSSCSSDSSDYDPYHHWRTRNEAWYAGVADSARTAIAAAQRQYGDRWEEHCDWRMYKSLRRSPIYQTGHLEDSICVHILTRGEGTVSPLSTDTVYINFRGWLMPTTDAEGNRKDIIFAQTYYGTFDPATAAATKSVVNAFSEGFETALQYMVAGDDWNVYIPQDLFYGSSGKDVIPGYSAALFRINMVKVQSVK